MIRPVTAIGPGALATGLTASRVALTVPAALAMARRGPRAAVVAGGLVAVAVATDVLDGRMARAAGTAGRQGQIFDHAADCAFTAAALAGASVRGAVPRALPPLVVAAFVQYVADSVWTDPGGPLRGSRLGRVNGLLYFAVPGLDAAARLGMIGPAVPRWLARTLVVTTLASMGQRAAWVVRHRAAGARRGGTPARSQR